MTSYLTPPVAGRSPRKFSAVEQVLGYGLIINARRAHTTAQIAKYTGLTVRSIERAQKVLKAERLVSRHVWMTQEGKRSLWWFHAVDEHPMVEALAEAVGVPAEIIGIPTRLVCNHAGIGRTGLMEIIGIPTRTQGYRFASTSMDEFLSGCGRSTERPLSWGNELDSELELLTPPVSTQSLSLRSGHGRATSEHHTPTAATVRTGARDGAATSRPATHLGQPRDFGAPGRLTAGTFDGVEYDPSLASLSHDWDDHSIFEAYRKGLAELGDEQPRFTDRIRANIQASLMETDDWHRVARAAAGLLDVETWGVRVCNLPGVPTVFEQDLDRLVRSSRRLHTELAQAHYALMCRLHDENAPVAAAPTSAPSTAQRGAEDDWDPLADLDSARQAEAERLAAHMAQRSADRRMARAHTSA